MLKRFFRALGGESSQSVPKYTLEKYHRLRDRARFEELLDHGERLYGTAFILLYLPNTLPFARLGIIVSKRKCKLSVDRNYVRRIIREQFRLNQQLLSGHDLIVLLKKKPQSQRQNAAKPISETAGPARCEHQARLTLVILPDCC